MIGIEAKISVVAGGSLTLERMRLETTQLDWAEAVGSTLSLTNVSFGIVEESVPPEYLGCFADRMDSVTGFRDFEITFGNLGPAGTHERCASASP